jgi:hypothetical protein
VSRLVGDEALHDLLLANGHLGLAELELLLFLSVLIRPLGLPGLLRPILDDLKRVSRVTPPAAVVEIHLEKLLGGCAGSVLSR